LSAGDFTVTTGMPVLIKGSVCHSNSVGLVV